jgi:hypothetical protein
LFGRFFTRTDSSTRIDVAIGLLLLGLLLAIVAAIIGASRSAKTA